MAEFVYTTVPGKITPLLSKIRQVAVPARVTVQWLRSIGFTSSNDASLIGILKFIGLIDSGGVPTSKWSQFRGTHHKTVLGEAIRQGYAELFAVYPDAWQRSDTDLEHVFSTSSSGGKQVIAKTISTFKTLAQQAEFPAVSEQTELQIQTGPVHTAVSPAPVGGSTIGTRVTPSVHIDVQIHISPEASSDQIDQIFKSMAKHLYGAQERE